MPFVEPPCGTAVEYTSLYLAYLDTCRDVVRMYVSSGRAEADLQSDLGVGSCVGLGHSEGQGRASVLGVGDQAGGEGAEGGCGVQEVARGVGGEGPGVGGGVGRVRGADEGLAVARDGFRGVLGGVDAVGLGGRGVKVESAGVLPVRGKWYEHNKARRVARRRVVDRFGAAVFGASAPSVVAEPDRNGAVALGVTLRAAEQRLLEQASCIARLEKERRAIEPGVSVLSASLCAAEQRLLKQADRIVMLEEEREVFFGVLEADYIKGKAEFGGSLVS